MALAPGFGLTDADGDRVTSDQFKGGFTLYTFAPRDCGERCDAMHDLFRSLQASLPLAETGGIPVRMVSVALDGDGVEPDGLQAQARALGADPEHWTVVSGDGATLQRVVRDGFGLWYQEEDDGSWAFDPTVVLVDQFGIRRRDYGYGTMKPEVVREDLARLGRESAAEGMASLAFEAAHFFACYSY
jgi:cytochrome oxidase Cu insertion factor (SCO1/SenC/PrrC family)